MAKKKQDKESDEVNDTNFDWKKALEDLVQPVYFKAGLGYYIETNKLDPKSDKEFNKILEDYGNIKMGA